MTIHATLPWSGHIRRIVEMALEEDLGRGDVTTDATVPPQTRGEAVMIARVPLVACGLQLAHEVYAQIDPEVQLFERAKDGQLVEKGAQLLHVSGSAASILKGERVALNFVQRM